MNSLGAEHLLNGLFGKAVGKVELSVLSCREARFELITKCHQFINFGDDAMLFSEWWPSKTEKNTVSCLRPASEGLGPLLHANAAVAGR